MKKQPNQISRRHFMKQTAAAAMLANLNPGTNYSPAFPEHNNKKRIFLKKPGPMIPPVPAILLTVKGRPGDPDEISVLWTFVVNGNPPQIGVSADEHHIAKNLIDLHEEFVLNVPTRKIVNPFDIIDMNSSRIADKFKLSGLTKTKAVEINCPAVEESPIHLECRVFNKLAVPPKRKIFLAEVVAVTVHENVCDEKGRLIVDNVPFFGMTSGSGEFYTMGEKVGHIGMSAGRDDIKY